MPFTELLLSLLASLGLSAVAGFFIGVAALPAARIWRLGWDLAPVIIGRAVALAALYGALFFLTGGLTGVYIVPHTRALAPGPRRLVWLVLFFCAGAFTMAVGLPAYTRITHLPIQPGLGPAVVVADGIIVAVLAMVILRFQEMEAEMRLGYQRLLEREQREAHLRELAARSELFALQAQISPHFFFNTLNTISALIEEDPTVANDALQELAALFRYSLGVSRRGQVSLREEWGALRQYLRLQQRRMGERLSVREEVDELALAATIPGLLLQPLVENAVEHGIAPSRHGGCLWLIARLQNGSLYLEVRDEWAGAARADHDPGQGSPSAGNGVALWMVRVDCCRARTTPTQAL